MVLLPKSAFNVSSLFGPKLLASLADPFKCQLRCHWSYAHMGIHTARVGRRAVSDYKEISNMEEYLAQTMYLLKSSKVSLY